MCAELGGELMRRRMIMQAGIEDDEIDYMHNPLESAEWINGHTYHKDTGMLTANTNEYCTSKFSLQNCGYLIEFDSDSKSWPDIFVWNENDEYVGKMAFRDSHTLRIWAKSGYKYAIKVYRTKDSDLSGVTITPINNEYTAIDMSIDLSNAEWAIGGGGYGNYIETSMNNYGMTTTNCYQKIQRTNYIIVFSDNLGSIDKEAWKYINNEAMLCMTVWSTSVLLITNIFGKNIDATKTYFAEHESLIFYK